MARSAPSGEAKENKHSGVRPTISLFFFPISPNSRHPTVPGGRSKKALSLKRPGARVVMVTNSASSSVASVMSMLPSELGAGATDRVTLAAGSTNEDGGSKSCTFSEATLRGRHGAGK